MRHPDDPPIGPTVVVECPQLHRLVDSGIVCEFVWGKQEHGQPDWRIEFDCKECGAIHDFRCGDIPPRPGFRRQ